MYINKLRIPVSYRFYLCVLSIAIVLGALIFAFLFYSNEEEPVRLLFAGDIMLSRSVAKQIEQNGNDMRFPFLHVASRIQEADIAFANLESPISSRGERVGSIYSFRAVPGTQEGLRYAGFDVMSLANNHIWDYGRFALEDTALLLRNSGIFSVGAGANEIKANEPAVLTIGDVPFIYLAYTNLYPDTLEASGARAGISHFDPDLAVGNIRELLIRYPRAVIIVSLHWGEEYEHRANMYQKRIARSFIDAGARFVIGHHPHVVQEVERYGEGLIAYSLGNFVFDQSFSTSTMAGLILEADIKDGSIVSVREAPVVINKQFQPMIASKS